MTHIWALTVWCTCCLFSEVFSIQSTLVISNSKELFETLQDIFLPRNIRVAEVRKTINRTTTFNKGIGNLTPEDRDILKILWKRGEIAPSR